MNKFTKKQILIGALILLFVINIAALGTIIYQNYQHKWKEPSFSVEKPDWSERNKDSDEWAAQRKGKDRWPRRNDSLQRKGGQQEGRGFEYFIKRRLQLDQEQFREFQTLHKENMELMKGIARELSNKRDTLMEELAKEASDSSKMNRLAREIGTLHTQLKKNTIDHFTKMKKLCTPEQRERLNRMIMEMADHGRHEPGAGMRKGGPPHGRMDRK
ncbi:MAG: periplasmic heavy metal sensor [Bacteroidales bacterium]|nr:periplasmic heavy metal sensor [Bacteroidales bacterium]MBS3774515.1 periplasmic heavy metal sensor [Bacteroidales bacterium]